MATSHGTLPGRLIARASSQGDRVALREKEFGIWQETSWAHYLDRVRAFSLGLIDLGLRSGDTVAIVGDNRPEWVISEIATQAAGAIPVGVYQDSVTDELQYVLERSGARVVVAEDQEQVDKVLEVRDALPRLDRIVYYDPRGLTGYGNGRLLCFPEVEERGRELHHKEPGRFDQNVSHLQSDGVALLCTTSGTTSRPKLAMLSHGNLLSMAGQFLRVDPMNEDDEFVSFLPLAWIGEQMTALSCALTVGFAVSFPEETGTVRQDLREIGPRVMFSPPRIWENLLSDVQVKMEDSTALKRRVYDWALGVGMEMADARFQKRDPGALLRLRHLLASWSALLPLTDQMGLRQIRHAYTGGAALGPDVFRFFHAIGVNLKQIYGQTEVSGISVLHRDDDVKFQTVGHPLPDTEIRVAEGGEVLTRSPSVFLGYYGDEEATAAALSDGWLRSGDAGYVDEDGHLVIIDRAKDVMILGDGTTFSPQFIENKLKFSPYVSEAVVFGGEHPFVTAIIAIDYANTGKWAERRQIAYTTFTDLAQKDDVYDLVEAHVEVVNADLPTAARIHRFLLLHKELDADDAELTRTRKVRRGFVAERYADLVEALYGDADVVPVETTITYQDGRTTTVRRDLRIASVSTDRT